MNDYRLSQHFHCLAICHTTLHSYANECKQLTEPYKDVLCLDCQDKLGVVVPLHMTLYFTWLDDLKNEPQDPGIWGLLLKVGPVQKCQANFWFYAKWAPMQPETIDPNLICAPGPYYGGVAQGSVDYEISLTLPHVPRRGHQTPELLNLIPVPYPLGHVLPCSYIGIEG